MKENDSFSMCHPLLNFFYFAVALLFTMFNQHPVFLGISYAGAFVYGGLLNGWRKTLKQGLLLTLPGLLIIALLNPMFNHYGVTMLYYIELDHSGGACLWPCTWCSHVYRDTVVFLLQYSDDK